MLRRREVLIGAGMAALGACAPKRRSPAAPGASASASAPASTSTSGAVPGGAAARWPPFAAGATIDAAAAVDLVWPDSMDPAEVAKLIAGQLAAARASGLSAVVTTVGPSGRFWLDDAAFDRTRRDIAAWKAGISHTGCRALSDLPRCTPDAELRMLADRGGVAGMIFWPYLRTDTQPMAIDLVRHIEHAIQVAGDPLVRLVAIERTRRHKSLGWAKGQVMMSPDFDAPLGLVVGSRDDA